MLARRFGAQSKVGQYLDPVADKILLTSLYIGLALGGAVPVWIVVLIFARDVWILLLSGIALRFTDFRGLQPSVWGKASTFFQIMAAVCVIGARAYDSAWFLRISTCAARRSCGTRGDQRARLQHARNQIFPERAQSAARGFFPQNFF